MVTRDQIIQWLRLIGKSIEINKEYLTELDAAIGDADHGVNMDRGFKKVVSQLPALEEKEIGDILKGVGMTLISSVGGASGPLYGTLFLRASAAASGKHELNTVDISGIWRAGLAGVVERGKAQPGDKTMVDALTPAVQALELASKDGLDTSKAIQLAEAAAEKGMKDTIPIVARKGRASYLGERSKGHQDPGATSTYLILRALAEAVA